MSRLGISRASSSSVDQAMRIMLHKPAGNEQINVRIINKSNVADVGTPAQNGKGYGDAFLTGYASAWGVSAPVLDRVGRLLAALSIWGPPTRVVPERFSALGAITIAAAAKMAPR